MTRFGTAGIRGEVPDDITPETAVALGRATALAAREGADDGPVGPPTVVVGRDVRRSGRGLIAGLIAGLLSGGATVRRLGRVPTPVLAYASQDRRGIMVTASHNPPTDNGFKLFRDGVEYSTAAEAAVEDRLERPSLNGMQWGRDRREDGAVERYCEAVTDYLSPHGEPLDGRRVAVDVGNGTAGATTPTVLRRLGADVVALDADPNGTFPSRAPKPTPETIAGFARFVGDGTFTLGVAHDGDGDRVVIVDDRGEIVHEDTVLAILAEYYVRAAGTVESPLVITTPNASSRIDTRVAEAGGDVDRVPLGDIHEGLAGTDRDVVFAGEPWKHCHPRLGGWLDATATAGLLALLVAGRGWADLRDPIDERPYLKADVECPRRVHGPVLRDLSSRLPEAFDPVAVSTEYGVRLAFEDGSWMLCRASGTESCLRLYVESPRADALMARLRELVQDVVDDQSGP